MEVPKIQHWAIKRHCGQVTYKKWRSVGCGFGGHGFREGISEKCGYYSNKTCSEKNCPLLNKVSYRDKFHEVVKKINHSPDRLVSTMTPL